MRTLIEWLTNLFLLVMCHWISHPLPKLVGTWPHPGGPQEWVRTQKEDFRSAWRKKQLSVLCKYKEKKKNSNKQSKRKCGHLEPECRQFCVSPVCKSCSGVTERGERGTQTRVIRKDRPGSPPEEFWADNGVRHVKGSPGCVRDASGDYGGDPENVPRAL